MLQILIDHFGLLVAVLSAAAMVVSVVYDIGCLIIERVQRTANLQRMGRETDDLAVALQFLQDLQTEASKMQGKLAELVMQRNRLERDELTARLSRFAFIHEVGEARPNTRIFSTELAVDPVFVMLPDGDVMFSRIIWRYKNTAQIWAENEAVARDLCSKVMGRKSAIHATKIIQSA
ncbi:MAG: hypothetical protein P4M00_17570 [Azospirillaceae bacterium]|nr:hypothetical protein [Azospirillaceae bacterium]